jgi:short-subunit dehydrogenase
VCINPTKSHIGPLETTDLTVVDDMIDNNVRSTVHIIRLLLPRMIQRQKQHNNGGRILVVGSSFSTVPSPFMSVYAGSQGFLASFVKVSVHLYY